MAMLAISEANLALYSLSSLNSLLFAHGRWNDYFIFQVKRQIYKGQAMQRQLQQWVQTPKFPSPFIPQPLKHKHINSAKPVVFLPVTLPLYSGVGPFSFH